tara:strand:- start:131 stop:337 length:207 start_codon:yes stop_codon:yes gene_type:complete
MLIGLPNSLIVCTQIICLFFWLGFISPIDQLSKKEREEKNKRKLKIVKVVEKARKTYENKFKKTHSFY